jgi:hypothetical protein
MVRLRPHPLGQHPGQAYRNNLVCNPFTLRYYRWKKYQFIDWALKNPRMCMGLCLFGSVMLASAYNWVIYETRWGERQPVFYAPTERPWTYIHFERDSRKPRGDYNANFSTP